MITIKLSKLLHQMKRVRRIIDCGPDRNDTAKTAGAYIAISLVYDVILDLVYDATFDPGEEGAKMGKTIKLELSRHDTINLIHALAIAYRSARREDTQAELGELYDRIQEELMKGEDDE